jgi:hypothetical protein
MKPPMPRPLTSPVSALLLVLAAACGPDPAPTPAAPVAGPDPEPACGLSPETLAGTAWALQTDGLPGGDVATRLRFYDEGGGITARYNVGSLSDMYSYACALEDDGALACAEAPRLEHWCRALLAVDRPCDPETLAGWAPGATRTEIDAAIAKAEAVVARYRDRPEWRAFVHQNNHAGNKLQGRLRVEIDSDACNLEIHDHYMSIVDGVRIEADNAAGEARMVRTDAKDLRWEHCSDSTSLVARETPMPPSGPDDVGNCRALGCTFDVGQEAWFMYLGEDDRLRGPGCRLSYDIWVDGHLRAGAQPSGLDKGDDPNGGRWSHGLAFRSPGVHVVTMGRYKQCGSSRTLIDASCTVARVAEAP